jgi:hypothetical protein
MTTYDAMNKINETFAFEDIVVQQQSRSCMFISTIEFRITFPELQEPDSEVLKEITKIIMDSVHKECAMQRIYDLAFKLHDGRTVVFGNSYPEYDIPYDELYSYDILYDELYSYDIPYDESYSYDIPRRPVNPVVLPPIQAEVQIKQEIRKHRVQHTPSPVLTVNLMDAIANGKMSAKKKADQKNNKKKANKNSCDTSLDSLWDGPKILPKMVV